MRYEGKFSFPTYSDVKLGTVYGLTGLEANVPVNYRDLKQHFAEDGAGNWVLMPVVPFSPNENNLYEGVLKPRPPDRESQHYLGTDSTGRKAYREKVQRYADEKKSIWEDVKHGVIDGSKAFVDRVRKDYLRGECQSDVQDYKKIVGDMDPGEIIEAASSVLRICIERLKRSRRISKQDMMKRDMMVYHLWQSGRFSNSEIGSQVGLSISSVSRRVGIFQDLLDHDDKLQAEYDKFISIIKV